jgi:sugar phosphate isomerase/epimerase
MHVKLGLLTACLPQASLTEVAAWASRAGYETLDLAAWPAGSEDPLEPCHIDVAALDAQAATDVRSLLDEHGLGLAALTYFENNLHADLRRRDEINAHLERCIDAAALLGAPTVCTFIGRDVTATVKENMRQAERTFPALAKRAESQGVKLAIENCVMEGWHPDGYPGNLAYSPDLWEWMFDLGLYLTFDPSHALWLGIEPVAALTPYLDRLAHAHAKDTECWPDRRNHFSFFGPAVDRTDPWDGGWWRYRLPGLGEVDWSAYVTALARGGYQGTLAVEHEDPVWEGSQQRVQEGLVLAQHTLAPLLER